MQPVGRPCAHRGAALRGGGGSVRPSARVPCTGPNEGAVRVANTSGLSPTVSGTPLPPVTPARIRWNVSAAYIREQDGHTDARRFPHRTCSHPERLALEEYDDSTSPVAVSTVWSEPRSRIGSAQYPTRAAAGPGVEVPRQQPGDDLRLGGGVEVAQVQRLASPPTGTLAGAQGDGVPDAVSCCPGAYGHPLPWSGWVCRAADATPRCTAHPVRKGGQRNDREGDAGAAGVAHTPATSRDHDEDHEEDGGPENVCVCDGNSCVWPLAGVGSRPPGHQARSFVSSGFCVGMSALPPSTARRRRRRNTPTVARKKFHPHADGRTFRILTPLT